MFNIIEKRKILFLIPAVILLVGIVFAIINGGFNTDIDFTGGSAMEVKLGTDFDESAIRKAYDGIEGVTVSSVQSTGAQSALIKTTEISQDQLEAIKASLEKSFPGYEILSNDVVSATMGKKMLWDSTRAIIFAVICMLIYIWIRFELHSGIAAVCALLHDVLVMLSVYAIFQLPVNATFIAAILTILGYSINATIVVFDRVRENSRFLRTKSFADVVNTSIWQTLARSINTSVTTLITLLCLYILGVTSIRQFALPLIIGVVCGTFSSVFIAGQFWVLLRGTKSRA